MAVRVGGIAKGSGMIHPDMATMLSVVTCDAAVEPRLWRALFKRSAVKSFNQARRCGRGESLPTAASQQRNLRDGACCLVPKPQPSRICHSLPSRATLCVATSLIVCPLPSPPTLSQTLTLVIIGLPNCGYQAALGLCMKVREPGCEVS